MRSIAAYVLLAMLLAVAGCKSEEPFVNNSIDPASFAKDVKEVVLSHAALAKKSSEPADSIGVIVETLSNLSGSPTGDHLSTYEQLASSARDLLEECSQSKGKPAGLNGKLDALVKLAKTLPGEVVVSKQTRD